MSSDRELPSNAKAYSSDVYRQIDPVGFYGEYIRRQVRPDGRKLRAFRTVGVSDLLEGATGSGRSLGDNGTIIASVRLTAGETHVHCTVKAVPGYSDVTIPLSPGSDNSVSVSVELPKQVQSYIYDANGNSANFHFCVATLLETVLNCDEVIPTTQLRFAELLREEPGTASPNAVCEYLVRRRFGWKLEIDILCEEYDGNLLDTSVLAASFALRKATLPIVLLDLNDPVNPYRLLALDQGILEQASSGDAKVCLISIVLSWSAQALKLLRSNRRAIEKQLSVELSDDNMVGQLLALGGSSMHLSRPLQLLALPFTVTFLRFSDETYFVDPTSEEERLGASVSVYCLRGADGSSRFQPLNLMCCPGVTTDVYKCLQQAATDLIDCIANTEF
ncbi:Exosome complex component protein [Babesia ovata]|uniref:Ribosomal RNA-processing protein 43 n=1 Tax=Babesia ovata TaxID=189622 RepID=A0A2H6K7B7_9APIC|nr:Exosome complex component protein [Babesia ovata]GBE58882.1 Exosome complex component protein [Babesia ovata]